MLVIIGLLAGGVLVGQNLIAAASLRAQISQIVQYNAAVNTFRNKYGGLPGDLNQMAASQFGFTARGGGAGYGDGNGVIEGSYGGSASGICQAGEPLLFWIDLSSANGLNLNLIDQSLSNSSTEANCACNSMNLSTNAALYATYWPKAKIGQGNYVLVNSGGHYGADYTMGKDGINYFGVSIPDTNYNGGLIKMAPGVTVAQAYGIDSKIDDGIPTTGTVTEFLSANGYITETNSGASDSATTCYNYNTNQYSTSISGSQLNCGLMFKMQ